MRGPLRLRHTVGQAIAEHALWRPGQRVVVAVSGGMDSMTLLDVLVFIQRWHGGALEVASVDHGTRPEAADEVRLVGEVAASHGLPFHPVALGLGKGASQLRCREARYKALLALGADAVATAHHLEDQVETVLGNLARGTGLRGLAGMRWRRGTVVRPLLEVRREDLRAWAVRRKLRWVEDPSNSQHTYQRSRIRADVVPAMEEARRGAITAISRATHRLAEDAALLDRLALEARGQVGRIEDGWPLEWARSTPDPLLRRALRAELPELCHAHVDAVLEVVRRGRGAVALPGPREAVIDGDRVWLREAGEGSGG